jgi:alpha-L-fucosidase
MNRRTILKDMAAAGLSILSLSKLEGTPLLNSSASARIAAGSFQPTWDSLAQFVVPAWFRDAKFGMWAHWGPQCQPEHGDWYARLMYCEGTDAYKYHCQKYGHPSKFGFKDVIHEWKAENWDPEELLALYKRAGARYFMALANHHDNLDLYESTYQSWNSTRVGPKKDIARGWAKAAAKQNLPLGLSVHASHAWSWYETAQRSDKQGPNAGVPYDGKLTAADGAGKWWEGLDPQELYAQNHPLSKDSEDDRAIHKQWAWGNGVCPPSDAYCEKFYKRTIELVDKYEPELLYFDDTALPFWPINDIGLRIAAHMYNRSIGKHAELRAVLFGKILNEQQRKCMVWDVERGQSNQIEPLPWQTDTCIGQWHYDRRVYEKDGYKSAKTVIHMLADIVSKNGNLLLNIPVRGDGTIDEKERVVVEGIAAWMQVNSEAIYSTRPWKQLGEGPAIESAAPLKAQGFNEGSGKPFGPEDLRFTTKGKTLYAIVLGWPEAKQSLIKSLSAKERKVTSVSMLGHHGQLRFQQTAAGLNVHLPAEPPCKEAFVLKIEGTIA